MVSTTTSSRASFRFTPQKLQARDSYWAGPSGAPFKPCVAFVWVPCRERGIFFVLPLTWVFADKRKTKTKQQTDKQQQQNQQQQGNQISSLGVPDSGQDEAGWRVYFTGSYQSLQALQAGR